MDLISFIAVFLPLTSLAITYKYKQKSSLYKEAIECLSKTNKLVLEYKISNVSTVNALYVFQEQLKGFYLEYNRIYKSFSFYDEFYFQNYQKVINILKIITTSFFLIFISYECFIFLSISHSIIYTYIIEHFEKMNPTYILDSVYIIILLIIILLTVIFYTGLFPYMSKLFSFISPELYDENLKNLKLPSPDFLLNPNNNIYRNYPELKAYNLHENLPLHLFSKAFCIYIIDKTPQTRWAYIKAKMNYQNSKQTGINPICFAQIDLLLKFNISGTLIFEIFLTKSEESILKLLQYEDKTYNKSTFDGIFNIKEKCSFESSLTEKEASILNSLKSKKIKYNEPTPGQVAYTVLEKLIIDSSTNNDVFKNKTFIKLPCDFSKLKEVSFELNSSSEKNGIIYTILFQKNENNYFIFNNWRITDHNMENTKYSFLDLNT